MSEGRYVRVVITTDVLVTDPSWDDGELRDNLVCYVQSAIDAVEDRARRFEAMHSDEERAGYHLLSEDATVFFADEFVLDLAEIAALPDDERAAMSTLANLPPTERRDFWFSDFTKGVPA